MNRRGFISMLTRGLATAAVAAHLELGRLVPVYFESWDSFMPVNRDYYLIDWPVVARNWTFGTYVNDVLDGALSKEYRLNGKLIREQVLP